MPVTKLFHDHDPRGKDIGCIGDTFCEFAPGVEINIKQVAVAEQQIVD